jgi:hypothetical protein
VPPLQGSKACLQDQGFRAFAVALGAAPLAILWRALGALVSGPGPDELIVAFKAMATQCTYITGHTLTDNLRYLAILWGAPLAFS